MEYCSSVYNSTFMDDTSMIKCHLLCDRCFGTGADQCYACKEGAVEVNVSRVCGGSVDITDTIYNCSNTTSR